MGQILKAEILKSLNIIDWGYTEQSDSLTFNHYQNWVDTGLSGQLSYLTDERKDKRQSIKSFYPEFQSAFVFFFGYKEQKLKQLESKSELGIASYALAFDGKDYHHVLRDRLIEIATELKLEDYKISLDIHPVLERDLAYRSGLGWFGKNSMLISKHYGSYFMIGSLLTNKKYENQTKAIEPDHCGTCRKCIDMCPTKAITEDRTIKANQCISTYTIETFKDVPPPEGYENNEHLIFGCDICQEVCPWNHRKGYETTSESTVSHAYSDIEQFFLKRSAATILKDLEGMSNNAYKRLFLGTALERPGRIGMMKNLKAIMKESDRANSDFGDQ